MAARPGSLGMILSPNLTAQGVAAGMTLHGKNRSKLFHEAVKSDEIMGNEGLIEFVGQAKKGDILTSSGSNMFIRATSQEYGDAAKDITFVRTDNIIDDSIDGNATKYTGAESVTSTRYATVSANDVARPLADFGWGIDKLDTDWWGLNQDKRRLLTQWLGERKGFHLREAICEVISGNLTAAPISLSKAINPNVLFVDGLVKPVYDSTLATFTGNIATGSTSVTAGDNHLTIRGLLDIGALAVENYIKPLNIAGGEYYIMWTSNEEIIRLRDSSLQGSIAKDYINAQIPKSVQELVPAAKLIVDKIVLCVDTRCPTMAVSGGGAITFGYVKQGRQSTRHAVTGGADGATYNVNMLMGADAVLMYERTMPNFKQQSDDYGRELGHLIHSCYGYQTCIWDKDTKTDTSARAEGSLLVLTSRQVATNG